MYLKVNTMNTGVADKTKNPLINKKMTNYLPIIMFVILTAKKYLRQLL